MAMLTVRLSCSVDEFEGGGGVLEHVDCWLVARGHAPLVNVDDDPDVARARFRGECSVREWAMFERFVSRLRWRAPEHVRVEPLGIAQHAHA